MRYSWLMLSFIFDRYCGTWPKSFFYSHLTGSWDFLALDKMVSTALDTMKFFPELTPKTGFSLALGTGAFLWLQS
jgi:hypothetical protein